MKGSPHSEAMASRFRADPTYAAELSEEVRREGDPAELAILMPEVAVAFTQNARCSHFKKRKRTLRAERISLLVTSSNKRLAAKF